jgi:hypothetical protein
MKLKHRYNRGSIRHVFIQDLAILPRDIDTTFQLLLEVKATLKVQSTPILENGTALACQ